VHIAHLLENVLLYLREIAARALNLSEVKLKSQTVVFESIWFFFLHNLYIT